MSWYLANTAGVGDQFASGAGLLALRKAAEPYASLMQFLDDGMTKNVDLCETQLRQLADRTDDDDVKSTVTGLADLMQGQDLVAITQGFGAAESGDDTDDTTDSSEALREADAPKHQAARDKAIRGALRKIQKLARNRFRAQRKAVLDSHALLTLKTVLSALREADDPDRAKLEADIALALSAQVYMVPVTADEQKTFAGAIKAAIDSGGEAAADMLSATPPNTESFIAEYLRDGGFSRLTGDLDQTTVDDLARSVADAYESGADFDGIVKAVKDSFAQANDYRARMIAQTKLNDAWGQSVLHFGREAGGAGKSWQADLTACVICLGNALDGIIPIEGEFSSGDDASPAHPLCGCSILVHA